MSEIAIPWGPVGYISYKRTYSRRLDSSDPSSSTEEYEDTIYRIIIACQYQLGMHLSSDECNAIRDIHLRMKGSVAGRFLWQLGTHTVDRLGLFSLQNCFSANTEFYTDKGIQKFSDFKDGDSVVIRGHSQWKPAIVREFGTQSIFLLTVKRRGKAEVIETTGNHRWLLSNNKIKYTYELQPNDVLKQFQPKTNFHNLKMCPIGIQHGLVFGDGNWNENAKSCVFTPCGDSSEEYRNFFFNKDIGKKEISGLPWFFKDVPNLEEVNKHYLYGFLAGWFAADGSVGKTCGSLTLCSSKKEQLEWARGAFSKLCVTTGKIKISRILSPFDGSVKPCYRLVIHRDTLPKEFLLLNKHKEKWKDYSKAIDWKVQEVNPTSRKETVWCVVEPDKEEFTLASGILTKNCAGIVVDSPIEPFTWTMDALMLGSGVGYNIQKEHVYSLPKLKGPVEISRKDTKDADFIVPDSREGWVELLRRVLEAHFKTGKGFSYSTLLVRGKGAAIQGFGGLASGPEELCWGMQEISKLLNRRAKKKLNPIDALDLMNIIGYIVVAGNVRRSAQLAIGDFDDLQYLNAKRWDLGNIPNWRAMSNNSVVCNEFGKLPDQFWQGYYGNGEPYGLINLKLAQSVGRTGEIQYPDKKVMVFNPCAEQSLEDGETCALAEVFLPNAESEDDLFNTCQYLYRIIKHSLSLKCHQPLTEEVVHRNMRMGIGMTGIMQATPQQLGWLSSVYERLRSFDVEYSKKHGFRNSIKLTTVKPSGTLSLLPGVTPGCHPGFSRYFIRRIRVAANSPLLNVCISHGYHVEPQYNFDGTPDNNTFVVSFPCSYPEGTIVAKDVNAITQLEKVAWLQKNWSDNAVSCTVYYKKEELADIQKWLAKNYDNGIKTVSFLLHQEHGFKQAPYEEISEDEYLSRKSKVRPINNLLADTSALENECEGGQCPIR
jgi:hypothetical protein